MSASMDTPTGNTRMMPPPMLVGRVMIADGQEHLCLARLDDLDAVMIATEASGRQSELATCYLDEIGMLPGRIGTTTATGFMLHPTLTHERRVRLAARLAWHATRAAWTIEQRAALRVVPEHRDVVVRLSDGHTIPGRILDVSKSGAKVQLASKVVPPVGSAVTLGKRYATIVRVTDAVIAVQFRLPFCDETFNPTIIL